MVTAFPIGLMWSLQTEAPSWKSMHIFLLVVHSGIEEQPKKSYKGPPVLRTYIRQPAGYCIISQKIQDCFSTTTAFCTFSLKYIGGQSKYVYSGLFQN